MTIETRENIHSCITGLLHVGMTSRLLGKGEISSITPAYINYDLVETTFVNNRAHAMA